MSPLTTVSPRKRPAARAAALLACALLAARTGAALDPAKALTQFGHDVWQLEQGLPQNSVYAIAQTPDGYLWLGTAEGLVRFDGVRFQVFDRRNTPAIPSSVVTTLCVDGSGTLWIGTDGGLVRLQGGRFRTYTRRDGLPSDRITALVAEGDVLWVATRDAVAARLEGDRFRLVGDGGGGLDRVTALARRPGGGIWAGTAGGRVMTIGADGARGAQVADLQSRVRALVVDTRGVLWIGTQDRGLFAHDAAGLRPMDVAGKGDVWALHEDRQGTLWAGTMGQGLLRIHGATADRFSTIDGLSEGHIYSLGDDQEGSLWIGTLGGGLNRLRDGKLTSFTLRDGLGAQGARAIAEDAKGAVWVGTEGGGLAEIEAGRVTRTLTSRDGLLNDRVYSIVTDREGSLWVAGFGRGLTRRRDGRLEVYVPEDPAALEGGVHTLLADPDGSFWLGTFRDGLHRLDQVVSRGGRITGRLTPFTTRQGLSNDAVLALRRTKDGALWVGTGGGGLNRLLDGHWTRYGAADGLRSDFVYALHEDSTGALWIGTFGGGLTRFKDGRLSVLTTEQGLFDDVIYGIVEDGAGWLWLTCNRGIFRVLRAELEEVLAGRRATVHSEVYGLADGMPSVECNAGGQPAVRTRDGRLWFATVKGVVVADPQRMPRNETKPPVHVEDVVVDGVSYGGGPEIALPPGGEKLELHYTALSLRAPARVRFRYRLEGLDSSWTEAETRRTAYYNRVPHGTYTFRVMASNDDGVWNEEGARVRLRIAPHLWETSWFYALATVLGVAALLGAHRLRVRQLKARKDELESLVDQRTGELRESEARALAANQAKSAFLARMSHELRTPLTGILGFAELLLRESSRESRDREALEIIDRSGQHLLRLINDILSLARIESGRVTLEEQTFDPVGLVEGVMGMFSLPARTRRLQLTATVDPGVPRPLRGDEGKLKQILINLVGNAIKFTREGSVSMRATFQEGRLRVDVEDTGPGIPEAERALLFRTFSQTTTGLRSGEGTGLGLAISAGFVRLLGGTLEALEAPAGGALFRLEVPLATSDEPVREPTGARRKPAPGQPVRRMLVVDDAPVNRLLLNRMLSGMAFTVVEAANGKEALAAWERDRPDLIWMDMHMDGMGGDEATREIRRQEQASGQKRTPIIAVTASALLEDRAGLIATGCDEVLIKPFSQREVAEVLERRLGIRFVDVPDGKDDVDAPPGA